MAVVHSSPSHLNLWKKQLGHVPDSVWEQTELETLVLADNGILTIGGAAEPGSRYGTRPAMIVGYDRVAALRRDRAR